MAEDGAPKGDGLAGGEPFSKCDAQKDLRNGPVKNRTCTDVIWLILFPVAIAGLVVVTLAGMQDGNPHQLYLPRDYSGGYCGVETNWNPNVKRDVSNFKWSASTMNVSKTFGEVAKAVACSTQMESAMDQLYSVDPTRGIEKSAFGDLCRSSQTWDAASLEATAQSFTDPSKAASAFGGSATGTFASAGEYFLDVCVTKCGLGQISADAAPNEYREYEYSPSEHETWKPIWDKLLAYSTTLAILEAAGYKFKAWPNSLCPYDPVFCVPYPGMVSIEGAGGYCIPTIDAGVASQIGGDTAGSAMKGISDLGSQASAGFGDLLGEVLEIYQVILLTGVAGIVVGTVFLVLLRFFIKPLVWLALIAVSLGLVLAGFLCMLRAGECASTYTVSEADMVLQSTSNPANIFAPQCADGFKIEDETLRAVLTYVGYVVLGLAALWLILIICLSCRINLACAINQAGAQFLTQNPHALIFPVLNTLLSVLWAIAWAATASFLVSQVPSGFTPEGAYNSWAEAAEPGKGACVISAPVGGVYKDISDASCLGGGACWKCVAPRYVLDNRFWFSFFMFLWISAFIVACTQTIICGAVGVWFFSKRSESFTKPVFGISIKNAFRYHIGSMAFGSFILAVVQFIKYVLKWLEKQARAQNNKCAACLLCMLGYLISCFERFIKFLNKNAYIQMALVGTNFCKSAYNAMQLILRNAVRFFVACVLSKIVHFIGKVFIALATTGAGYLMLMAMYPDANPIFPTMIFFVEAYICASIYMSVFGLAVDTTLQAFIIAEELGPECVADFVPADLRKYIDSGAASKEDKMTKVVPA